MDNRFLKKMYLFLIPIVIFWSSETLVIAFHKKLCCIFKTVVAGYKGISSHKASVCSRIELLEIAYSVLDELIIVVDETHLAVPTGLLRQEL